MACKFGTRGLLTRDRALRHSKGQEPVTCPRPAFKNQHTNVRQNDSENQSFSRELVSPIRQIGLVVWWLVSLEQIKTSNSLFERA